MSPDVKKESWWDREEPFPRLDKHRCLDCEERRNRPVDPIVKKYLALQEKVAFLERELERQIEHRMKEKEEEKAQKFWKGDVTTTIPGMQKVEWYNTPATLSPTHPLDSTGDPIPTPYETIC